MIFPTQVAGIPCQCEVTYYRRAEPMLVYGMGMGDCFPPEPEEFQFRLLDRKGYPAPWLEVKLNPDQEERIYEEFVRYSEQHQHREE